MFSGNGLRTRVIDERRVVVLAMIIDGEESSWIEFNRDQLANVMRTLGTAKRTLDILEDGVNRGSVIVAGNEDFKSKVL